jgi:hypothetical protein
VKIYALSRYVKCFFLELAELLGCAYGIFMLLMVVLPLSPPLHSQPRTSTTEWQQETDRRITALENLNTDHRLTVLETIRQESEDSLLWSRISTGGMGLLVAERMASLLRKQITRDPGDADSGSNSHSQHSQSHSNN